MRRGPFMAIGILAMAGFLAGCRTAPPEVPAGGDGEPNLDLSRADADMAEALASYAMGIIRDGLADDLALEDYERAARLKPERVDLYLRMAAIRLRQGQSAAALDAVRNACRANPRSVEARLCLAQLHQSLKQWPAAREACRDAIRVAPGDIRGYLQLAMIDREQGDLSQSLTFLEEALPKLSDQRSGLRLLGDLYLQRNGEVQSGKVTPDLQRAMEYYQRAADEPRDDLTVPYLKQLGDLYLVTRQADKAIACFSAVLAQAPDDIPAQKKLAHCYLAVGDTNNAVQHLQTIARLEPRNAAVQYYLGELYETLADPTNALARFTAACDGDPPWSHPFLKLALIYLQSDPQKAVQVLESGRKQFPEDQQILERLTQLYLAQFQEGEAKKALASLGAIVARHPDRALAARQLMLYGLAAQQHRLKEIAAVLYQQALELDPGFADAYFQLAFLDVQQGRPEDALRVMERAGQTIPDDFQVNYYSGLIFSRLGRFADALEAFERAWDAALADPDWDRDLEAAFLFSYGSAFERAGQFAQAEALLQYVIALAPDNPEAFNYLAYMWAERGVHLDLALDYVGQALDQDPENGAYLDTLGWIYFQQGRLTEALAEIGNARAFLPDDPTILEHLGDVLMALQRAPEALAAWRESFRRDAGNAALGEKLRQAGADIEELRRNVIPPPSDKR